MGTFTPELTFGEYSYGTMTEDPGISYKTLIYGSFSPLSLFAASEPGFWYDPSDLSTLFQDTAGTTPVTAAGQSVARINDKSGRGNHATQATAAQRPQYQVYSKPVLNGDFVDDNITFDGSAMTACQSAYVTQNGWMVGGASGSNYGSLSRIPLGRVTQYIVNPNILTNADRLSAYFGVDQYYFVGMTTDSTVFHRIDSPAGTYPITYVGANGVTYTQTANNVTTDLVAQGLTSPFTMLVPKAVLSDAGMTLFHCHDNQLTGSIPSLSANTALTEFSCSINQLTGSIPSLSANTALKEFYCSTNQLTGNIPSLSSNTALSVFYCYSNQLTGNIPSLSANTLLSIFHCYNNQLTGSIPNLSANTALTMFFCHVNQLTGSIPSLSANTALSVFFCHFNQLTGNIPSLSANTALTEFRCDNNQITGWSGGTVSATLGDFQAPNNLLMQAAVDAILAAFVAAGRTTGTRILNLGGTGNAAPSAAGLADKATLQSRGWTVTTN